MNRTEGLVEISWVTFERAVDVAMQSKLQDQQVGQNAL